MPQSREHRIGLKGAATSRLACLDVLTCGDVSAVCCALAFAVWVCVSWTIVGLTACESSAVLCGSL